MGHDGESETDFKRYQGLWQRTVLRVKIASLATKEVRAFGSTRSSRTGLKKRTKIVGMDPSLLLTPPLLSFQSLFMFLALRAAAPTFPCQPRVHLSPRYDCTHIATATQFASFVPMIRLDRCGCAKILNFQKEPSPTSLIMFSIIKALIYG